MKRLIKRESHALAAIKANANVFEIFAYFREEARARDWSEQEISEVWQQIEQGTYPEAQALMASFYEKNRQEVFHENV